MAHDQFLSKDQYFSFEMMSLLSLSYKNTVGKNLWKLKERK